MARRVCRVAASATNWDDPMSFILDALKKSESDRQQRSAPDISNVPTRTVKATTPRWLWILVGLLAINLVVLTVVLLKPSPLEPAATVTRDPERVVEPPPNHQQAEIVRNKTATPAVQEKRPPPEPKPEVVRSEPIVNRSTLAATAPQLTFNDLRASGNLSLPDLNIDIHVYSDKPADRFVFINMNQYRENATLEEGPLLREITTEGVILEYVGAVFLLPKD